MYYTNFKLIRDLSGYMAATIDITTVKYFFFKTTVKRNLYKQPTVPFWRWEDTKVPVPDEVELLASLGTFKMAYEKALKGL